MADAEELIRINDRETIRHGITAANVERLELARQSWEARMQEVNGSAEWVYPPTPEWIQMLRNSAK